MYSWKMSKIDSPCERAVMSQSASRRFRPAASIGDWLCSTWVRWLSARRKYPRSNGCERSATRSCTSGDSVPVLGCLNGSRSEEHTSELQSRFDLVCRLLLEKKK